MPRRKKKYTDPPAAPVVPIATAPVAAEYLDIPQAAAYLSATTTSARRWLKKQKLACAKIGRRFVYRRSDIDAVWQKVAA
jgi:hypothetical protein